jgi:phage terminase large subunit GpA-like protein
MGDCGAFSYIEDEVPRIDDMRLASRAARGYPLGEIPPDAAVVTIGADNQKREAWWLSLAMAQDLRWWIVDYGYRSTGREHSEPTPEEQRAFLDAMFSRAKSIGRCDARGVDAGYNTDLVTGWARANDWLIVRGDNRGKHALRTGKKETELSTLSFIECRRQTDRSLWHFIDTDAVKTELARGLSRDLEEPGAGHLPAAPHAKDYLIRHLISERFDPRAGWVKRPSIPNHLWDCLVYAYALARLRIARPKMTAKLDLPIGSDGVFAGLMG